LSTDVSEVRAASIIRAMMALIVLMMEAARISETSVDNCFTRQYIPEDKSELHARRRENLKSHLTTLVFLVLQCVELITLYLFNQLTNFS
jgi:hypothetical protein